MGYKKFNVSVDGLGKSYQDPQEKLTVTFRVRLESTGDTVKQLTERLSSILEQHCD